MVEQDLHESSAVACGANVARALAKSQFFAPLKQRLVNLLNSVERSFGDVASIENDRSKSFAGRDFYLSLIDSLVVQGAFRTSILLPKKGQIGWLVPGRPVRENVLRSAGAFCFTV
jgi:hypothetical protein